MYTVITFVMAFKFYELLSGKEKGKGGGVLIYCIQAIMFVHDVTAFVYGR